MFNLIFSITIYILFAILFFTGIQKHPLSDQDEFGIRINAFRGVIALSIVIGHCVRYEKSLLTPFGNMMLIGVGYFLFVSSYGLSRSYHTKSGYIDSFLKKRVLRLIYISALALILTKCISWISPIKTGYSINNRTIPTIISAILVNTNWYLRELLLLYLLFFLIYKYVKKNRIILLILCTIILSVVLYFLGYTRCWYASILSFPLGTVTYEYYDALTSRLKTVRGISLAIIITLIGFSQLIFEKHLSLLSILTFSQKELILGLFNNFLCIGFLLIIVVLLQFFSFGNKIYTLLSKYSTQLYVLQFPFLAIIEKCSWDYPYDILFVLTMDFGLTFLTYRIFNPIH